MTRFSFALALALLAAGLVATFVDAAPLPTAKPADGPAVRARKALDAVADFQFENATLSAVAEHVRDRGKVAVSIDQELLMQMGLNGEAPTITVSKKGVSLRDGLRAALAPLHARAGVVGGEIVISTEEGLITRQLRCAVSVAGDDRPLTAVVAELAGESGANIVLDPREAKKAGDAKVALTLDDVPLETAVRLSAEVAGFSVVRLNNVLFITSDERAAKLRPDADGPTPAPSGNPFIQGFGGGIGGIGGAIPVPAPPAAPADKEEK